MNRFTLLLGLAIPLIWILYGCGMVYTNVERDLPVEESVNYEDKEVFDKGISACWDLNLDLVKVNKADGQTICSTGLVGVFPARVYRLDILLEKENGALRKVHIKATAGADFPFAPSQSKAHELAEAYFSALKARLGIGRNAQSFAVGLLSKPAAPPRPRVCTFPGKSIWRQCGNRVSRAMIEWRDPGYGKPRQLWLYHGRQAPAKLLDFDGSVDVRWSPDGRAFAITHHGGNNTTSVFVGTVDTPRRLVRLEDEFIRTFGKLPTVYKKSHRDFSAQFWSSIHAFVFTLRAFDPGLAQNYRGTFLYDLDGHVREQQ